MARAAFVMDGVMRRFGLQGRSFVPLVLGFGCTVPAIMATRCIESERDRKTTIMVLPLMSCGARLPIYALIVPAFFAAKYQAFVMWLIYLIGVVIALVAARLMKSTLFRGEGEIYLMELPPYRLPTLRTTMQYIRRRIGDFIRKAFSVILLASLAVWFLQSFDFRLRLAASPADSMLADIGSALSVLFAPLGWRDWRLTAALLTGLTAKEAVLSTLAVLTGAEGGTAVAALFASPQAAATFCVFVLLYPPCVAAMAAVRRETSRRFASALFVFQTAVAYFCALAVYRVGNWLA